MHIFFMSSRGLVILCSNFGTKTNSELLELKASFRESSVTPKTNGQRSQLISQTLKSAAESRCRQDLRACLVGLCIFGLTESSYTISVVTCGFIVLYQSQLSSHYLNSTTSTATYLTIMLEDTTKGRSSL